MDHNDIKYISEIEAVKRFLVVYNKENGTDYYDIEKNEWENAKDGAGEVDVYCHSHSDLSDLKIQVTKCDPNFSAEFGKYISYKKKNNFRNLFENKLFNRKVTLPEFFERLKIVINKKSNKYKKEVKKDLILLLDNLGSQPNLFFYKFKEENRDFLENTGFVEVWVSGYNNFILRLDK